MHAVLSRFSLGAALVLVSQPASAIRPFVTDDARVVGQGYAQLESWVLVNRLALEHSNLFALGPTDWLEVTAGFVHGGVYHGPDRGYSFTGPILQAKALLLPAENNGLPGLAVAGGALAPYGGGPLTSPGWGGFGYLALTESLNEEAILIHANVGFAVADPRSSRSGIGDPAAGGFQGTITLGLGTQIRVAGGLHGIAEIYYGDPYDASFTFPASQVGARYIFSDHVQMDSTLGTTLTGVTSEDHLTQTEQWGTLGIRLVTPELWNRGN